MLNDDPNDFARAANASAYDRMAIQAHPLARPVKDDELQNPLAFVDEAGWLGGNIQGWNVLCLAAGGGRHSVLYNAAGANVTVVDLSPGMLDLDRRVAEERKLNIRIIQTCMSDLTMLANSEFNLVIHPVSTCYLPKIGSVFSEVSRVLKSGGIYVSQHKQPISLQSSLEPIAGNYIIEKQINDRTPAGSPKTLSRLREPQTREYAHSIESILGGICRNQMVIEAISEPLHAKPNAPAGSFGHRCSFIPPYIRIKARKTPGPSHASSLARDSSTGGIILQ